LIVRGAAVAVPEVGDHHRGLHGGHGGEPEPAVGDGVAGRVHRRVADALEVLIDGDAPILGPLDARCV
jgi:hypothetical protein